jgi:hypothetical protein
MGMAVGRSMQDQRNFKMILIGVITSDSMSTSMATQVRVLVQRSNAVGLHWSRN